MVRCTRLRIQSLPIVSVKRLDDGEVTDSVNPADSGDDVGSSGCENLLDAAVAG